MSITVKFSCDGCFKKAEGTTFLSRHFYSVNNKGYGFGQWRIDVPKDITPEGWIDFDPYTGGCYCPDCWTEIKTPDAKHNVT